MAPSNPFKHTKFIASYIKLSQVPPAIQVVEIAFAGRSNAGKSSLMNALCEQKKLARISQTPGKTRELNFFKVNEKLTLTDLPGYGYATVSKKLQEEWGQELTDYLATRSQLRGVVIIMDIRHPLTDRDQEMVNFAIRRPDLKIHIVLNKDDKFSRNQRIKAEKVFEKKLHEFAPDREITYQTASAKSGNGMNDLRSFLMDWSL